MGSGVKKLGAVVVGAVVGFIQGNVPGAIAGAALAWYGAEQQEKLTAKSSLRDNEPSAQTVRSPKAPVRFILGKVSTGGVLVWAQEQVGAQAEGEWVHLVYVISEGAVDGLEDVILGEESISTYGSYASYELVSNPTTVNAFLKANCPDWKDTQIGRGISFVRVSLQYNAEKFPSGIPDTRFIVRGRNDLYDPRTGASVYSTNTALHILWYLRNRCNVPDDEIVFSTFASAANICDELVDNADGTRSARYTTSCVIGADEQRTQVMQKLEAACAGKLIRVGGRWMLQVGAYYGPYDFEITEDMVIGTITGGTEPTNDGAINTVRGTFIDTTQSWTETDYPEVVITEWVTEDGGEAAETLSFSYVNDPYQAQRLANIELRRRRASGAINIPMNFLGYNCRPGRAVRVNLPSLNILGEFVVTNWSMSSTDSCSVSVEQYDAEMFGDAVGVPYNPIGFINLPAGGLGSPTGVTWTQDTSAEVTQGVLSWSPPSGIVTEYIVTVRQGATVVQAHNVPAASTQIAISGLPSGNYTMSVAALGPMARSGEATITVSVNGPPIPEGCTVQSGLETITLIPRNVVHGLNGGTYEYWFSTNPQATAATAQYLGQGLTFTHNGLAFYTNYYYFIRSVNAYGMSAFLYVPAATSNDVSAYLAALAGKITETQLGGDLLTKIDKIDEIDGLQEQIDNLSNPVLYDKTVAYANGAIVYQGDRLYQAIAAVPANAAGNNAPPNATYWKDVGQILTTANGLVTQVNQNTSDINAVSAQASSLQSLVAARRDDGASGALADALNSWNSIASAAQETKVRAEQDYAQTQVTTTLQAAVGDNAAKITAVQQVVADGQTATAQQLAQLSSTVGDNAATVTTLTKTVADNQSATATSLQQLSTTVGSQGDTLGQQQTAITQTTSIVNDINGKLAATWSVKMQYSTSTGQYIAAGIGLGIENTAAGLQSQFLVSADRFAVVNTIAGGTPTVPFAVQGGQVFINSAIIQDASVSFLKIGDNVQSTNYVAGTTGWKLWKDGTFEINGNSGGGRQQITNAGGKVFDENGVKRFQWGNLSV